MGIFRKAGRCGMMPAAVPLSDFDSRPRHIPDAGFPYQFHPLRLHGDTVEYDKSFNWQFALWRPQKKNLSKTRSILDQQSSKGYALQ